MASRLLTPLFCRYISIVLAILQAETTFVSDFLCYISPLLNTRDTQNLTKGRNS